MVEMDLRCATSCATTERRTSSGAWTSRQLMRMHAAAWPEQLPQRRTARDSRSCGAGTAGLGAIVREILAEQAQRLGLEPAAHPRRDGLCRAAEAELRRPPAPACAAGGGCQAIASRPARDRAPFRPAAAARRAAPRRAAARASRSACARTPARRWSGPSAARSRAPRCRRARAAWSAAWRADDGGSPAAARGRPMVTLGFWLSRRSQSIIRPSSIRRYGARAGRRRPR